MFLEWSAKLWQVLDETYPLPPGIPPIPEHELLPPRYLVSLKEASTSIEPITSRPLASFLCNVKQNQRITAPGHWQDVRHIILESKDPALDYEPGDIAVVWPQNPKEEVDIFLDTLHWTDIADTPLTITSASTGISLTDTPN
jgi:sulfite reductase alpha subunit-like flavoprotein